MFLHRTLSRVERVERVHTPNLTAMPTKEGSLGAEQQRPPTVSMSTERYHQGFLDRLEFTLSSSSHGATCRLRVRESQSKCTHKKRRNYCVYIQQSSSGQRRENEKIERDGGDGDGQ